MTGETAMAALTAGAVAARLDGAAAECTVEVLDTVDSTNTELKRRAPDGAADGTVVIARQQTGGHGRRGRTFLSPPGGLYMSVLLRQAAASTALPLLTIATATAVAEAAEAVCGQRVALKWVNDVYRQGRKVCGILAEALSDGASGVQCVIVGIGVNLSPPEGGFPADIPAGALFDGDVPKDAAVRLAAGILNRLMWYARRLEMREYLPGYRARSMLDGRTIAFCERGVWQEGVAAGIDEDGGLCVRLADGRIRTLQSGEVTMHCPTAAK